MNSSDLIFVIPTYRLREVDELVEQYDRQFSRNGHSVPIVAFDDSSPANQQKYFPLPEQIRTHNDLVRCANANRVTPPARIDGSARPIDGLDRAVCRRTFEQRFDGAGLRGGLPCPLLTL
jgi:hypothetical protein